MSHFVEGLKEAGLLDIFRELPEFFEPLLTSCSSNLVTAESVKRIMKTPWRQLNDSEAAAVNNLVTFIEGCTDKGELKMHYIGYFYSVILCKELKSFLHFVTGSMSVHGNHFYVNISTSGEIIASTCSNTISIPPNIECHSFIAALKAVIDRESGSSSFTVV